jgi:hypothetical protein
MRRLFFRRRFCHGNRGFRHFFLGPGGVCFSVGILRRILPIILANNLTNEPMPHFDGDILVDRAGMRLLLVYSQSRK